MNYLFTIINDIQHPPQFNYTVPSTLSSSIAEMGWNDGGSDMWWNFDWGFSTASDWDIMWEFYSPIILSWYPRLLQSYPDEVHWEEVPDTNQSVDITTSDQQSMDWVSSPPELQTIPLDPQPTRPDPEPPPLFHHNS